MKLTLLSHQAYQSILLPEKCAGQYWLRSRDPDGKKVWIVAVEGIRAVDDNQGGQWVLKSNSKYQIIGQDQKPIAKATLDPLMLYVIRSTEGGSEYRLYTEPLSENRKQYQAYEIVTDDVTLEIGRSPGSDIRYGNDKMSKNHATLHISASGMQITDNDSLNHTYVNGLAVRKSALKTGDVIYIMGMQIVVTERFLYINDPDGKVNVQSRWLQPYHVPEYLIPVEDYEEDEPVESADYYYRAPRFKQDVDPLELKLDAPPARQTDDNMPMIMSIGPSITMGMASATTAAFSVVNAASSGDASSAIPSIVMSVGMLSGTLLWPVITKAYQKKINAKKEAARLAAYAEYLKEAEQRVSDEIARQEQLLRNNDKTTADYLEKVCAQPLQIWERTPKHSDFLRLRLGCGRKPLIANIQHPERHFSVECDELMEKVYQFGEKERWLNNVPICLSLKDRFISGVYSDRKNLLNYAKSLILQLTALHGYDEVKLVILYDESDESQMSFVRWLPHTMDRKRRIRYIATTAEETKILSADLDPIIEYRKKLNAELLQDESPYYVVLCMSKELATKAKFLRPLLDNKENIGFSVISMYERLKDLPKECMAVVALDGNTSGSVTLLNDESNPQIPFEVDVPEELDMRRATEVLANTFLDDSDSSFQLPSKYTFLEMMDMGMVEHINLVENWSANDPTKSLAAPIGIDAYGDSLCLDLHECVHGPHGLIAGMTGSGKSETIISYILSMAINYHPNEVSFVLIDYKGGGMAKAFENIPHTAGIITNLDGNSINRSLVSMQSELHRRERIFQSVSRQHNVSNIDIYKYQKLYRENKVTEPLPHLIIISDEFAELKKDQPDFMAALNSTARVGRSLGVHLILATQKPGGVVDDQIRSNSRFRLCLKVQDNGDSMEMMGRSEAASLVETGRFYLQVGNNELFEMGQSAWAGAPYYPAAKAVKELDDAVSIINTNGQIIAEVNTDRYAGRKDARKQLDVITEYIRKVSDEEQIFHRRLWLEPLPAKIYLDRLSEKYPVKHRDPYVLDPIVGEYDDPTNQTQGVLKVPITGEGNVIVYGSANSGKSTFLQSVCYSLMREHTPDEVNMYIMDFGSETMTAFSGTPHVGDVILSHETEKVENLFKLMEGKLNSRKKLLSQFGGSLEQYNAQATIPEPNIVVLINDYANFSELYETQAGELNHLTREGTKYGIYFILSCTGINNVRFSLLQNFKCLYCLQMNNPGDYVNVVGKTGGLQPSKFKGRGLVRMDKDRVLEFQTALASPESSPYEFFRSVCKELASKYPDKQAKAVPVLPEAVSVSYLTSSVKSGNYHRVPVGVEKESLEIAFFDFAAQPVHLVISLNSEWKAFTESLAMLLTGCYGADTIVLSPTGFSGNMSGTGKLRVCSDCNSCVKAIYDIYRQVLIRNNTYKDALAEGKPAPVFEPMFVVIESMAQLRSTIEGYKVENSEASDDTPLNRLQVAMEKCAKEYGVHFIVAENLQTLTPFTAEKWYKTQVNSNNGIWIGDGIGSQYRLNITKKPVGFNAALEEHFGYLISNATATLVKFLQ